MTHLYRKVLHIHMGKKKKINSNSSLNTGRRHKTGEESIQIKYYPKKLQSLWPWRKCSSNLLYLQWSKLTKSSPNRKTGSPGANPEPYWFSALTITKRIGPYWEDKSFHDSWISNLSQNKTKQLKKKHCEKRYKKGGRIHTSICSIRGDLGVKIETEIGFLFF